MDGFEGEVGRQREVAVQVRAAIACPPQSDARNRIPGTKCTESAVSRTRFRGGRACYALPGTDTAHRAIRLRCA
eukprot:3274962-Rhodomonas_salina.1